ncbi:MAG: hypothetical protein HY040_28050 [Planctomycetes bacterium]|nr:hypothetical protein [Planctomycetota bacterium]
MARTRRRQKRGRRVLLSALIAFAGVQVLASALLDYGWPQLRCPMYHLQVENAAHCLPAPGMICLGSSRSGCLLDDVTISQLVRQASGDRSARFFNASVPAGDAEIFDRMQVQLLSRDVRPHHALIEVCPENLNRYNRWLPIHLQWYFAWNDVPSHLSEVVATGNLMRLFGTRFLAQFAHRDAIQRKLAEEVGGWFAPRPPIIAAQKTQVPEIETPQPPQAVQTAPPTPRIEPKAVNWDRVLGGLQKADGMRDRELDASVVKRELRDYQPGGNSVAALERLLTRCREDGVEVILYTPPLASTHRACYTPEIEQRFQECLGRLTQNFHCRYVDYRQALPDQAFRDHHHAVEDARAPFSHKLGTELIVPAWTGQHER